MSTQPGMGGETPEQPPRTHPQDPAEGADPDVDQGPDAPEVHPQDPAEGQDDPDAVEE